MNVEDKAKDKGMVNSNKLYGKVTYKAYDKNHNLVSTGTATNNIVLGIREPIIMLLGGFNSSMEQLPFVNQLRLGDGENVTPKETDTDLKRVIPGSTTVTNTTPTFAGGDYPYATFSFMYDAECPAIEGRNIHEMGLFTRNNKMVAHVNVGTWTKAPGLYFEIYWTIGYRSAEDA